DRYQLKEYAIYSTELTRAIGVVPTKITNQGTTFNAPPVRWDIPQELAAPSMNTFFNAAFEGCLTYTGTATNYAANPTATTAQTECAAMQKKFWMKIPSAADTTSCVNFATSAANNDANPRRR